MAPPFRLAVRTVLVLLTLLVGLGLGITLFGNNLRKLMGASAESLAGQPFASSRTAPQAPWPSEAPPPHAYTRTSEDRLSTFAVDVDTASYTLFRRYVTLNRAPPPDSIRVEEWVNYFRYRYPSPSQGDFGVSFEGAPSPYTPGRTLVRVGLQGRTIAQSQRKPTHLVFLVDTSGSMNAPDKLPLAQKSMKLLVDGLNETDTVALVTYAGSVRDVLPPTPAAERERLFAAIDALTAGGATAMGSGLELAYRHAVRHAGPQSVSRVVVLTDGDTHLGPTSADGLLAAIQGYVSEGVTLSTIGLGMGNYRDGLMERLADQGNGNCFYIDSEREARRVFQERLAGTLEVIAQDVKVQVEFDPRAVRGYRLMGYENRDIADRDFREDKVDAGELGAGHTVTALYELELTGEGEHLATVRVRAKRPGGREAAEQRFPLERASLHPTLREASADLRFAAAVAGAADILRGAPPADGWSLATAESLAEQSVDGQADRAEFLGLLRQVRASRLAPLARAARD